MCQLRRIAPLAASAALIACAATGCSGTRKGGQAESLEPPVMVQPGEDTAIAKAQNPMPQDREVDMVEEVGRLRAQYRQALESLRAFYGRYGYHDKANWAAKEIGELAAIPSYPYLGDPLAASVEHAPKETLANADTLYAQARKAHQDATGLAGMLGGSKEKLAEALKAYRAIIKNYPNSDKIDDAAFYAGEILASDTYKESKLALDSYERCLKWNPTTEHPVRFRMAMVYDYQIRDRAKAVAMYKQVVQSDRNRANVRFAEERIRQLTDRASHEAPDAEPGLKR